MDTPTSLMAEKQRLEVLESVIDAGMQTFVHVGNALLEIRDGRLYRQTHATFEDYCRERWGFKRSYAYELIDAASTMANLSGVPDTPKSVSQLRPLTTLEPDQQREAWQRAVEAAETVSNLSTIVDILPTAETHIRPLTVLEPAQR